MTSPLLEQQPDRVISGQSYWLVRTEPHRCRDGRMTALSVFRSHCAVCGHPFEAKAPAGSGKYLNRRCEKHHRPGIQARKVREPKSAQD